jgi:PIN domain nuclease of toxin-antitoxin system
MTSGRRDSLVDTCVILWAALHPERISRAAAEAITDPESRRFLSPLSMYEIAQKTARGKLELPLPPAAFIEDSASRMRLAWLPLTDRHLSATIDGEFGGGG